MAAAVVGGTASEISGGKFANGAVTGAFSRLFNDEMHNNERDPESVSMVGIKRGPLSVGVSADARIPGIGLVNMATQKLFDGAVPIPSAISGSALLRHDTSGNITRLNGGLSLDHEFGFQTAPYTATVDVLFCQSCNPTNSADLFLGFGGRAYFDSSGFVGFGLGGGFGQSILGRLFRPGVNVGGSQEWKGVGF